ncbi:hypothetical protein C7M84_016160 [Penaeus vannamei]|uniref:Uncharacterized protein n=1 Tax=Penaeus vannamei TaxID=6689 RepID=A0A423SNU3_PENVA|nr:hypothetical protein C7M84_016160 [Penaeus vannamei]
MATILLLRTPQSSPHHQANQPLPISVFPQHRATTLRTSPSPSRNTNTQWRYHNSGLLSPSALTRLITPLPVLRAPFPATDQGLTLTASRQLSSLPASYQCAPNSPGLLHSSRILLTQGYLPTLSSSQVLSATTEGTNSRTPQSFPHPSGTIPPATLSIRNQLRVQPPDSSVLPEPPGLPNPDSSSRRSPHRLLSPSQHSPGLHSRTSLVLPFPQLPGLATTFSGLLSPFAIGHQGTKLLSVADPQSVPATHQGYRTSLPSSSVPFHWATHNLVGTNPPRTPLVFLSPHYQGTPTSRTPQSLPRNLQGYANSRTLQSFPNHQGYNAPRISVPSRTTRATLRTLSSRTNQGYIRTPSLPATRRAYQPPGLSSLPRNHQGYQPPGLLSPSRNHQGFPDSQLPATTRAQTSGTPQSLPRNTRATNLPDSSVPSRNYQGYQPPGLLSPFPQYQGYQPPGLSVPSPQPTRATTSRTPQSLPATTRLPTSRTPQSLPQHQGYQTSRTPQSLPRNHQGYQPPGLLIPSPTNQVPTSASALPATTQGYQKLPLLPSTVPQKVELALHDTNVN